MKKIINLTILFALTLAGFGQQDLTIYHMPSIQQVQYVNPAFRPDNGINIGIPLISSIYLRQQNTFLNPSSLFKQEGNQLVFQTEDFAESLSDHNFIGQDFSIELFSFGMKFGKNYASFTVKERSNMRFSFPKDLLLFPFTGNASFDEMDNGKLDFSGLDLMLNHYREYGIGWQRELPKNLNIGVKVKYLYGMENVSVKKSDLFWQTDEETWDSSIQGQLELYSSGFGPMISDEDEYFDIEDGDINDYLFKRKNRGLGIDLGVTKDFSDKLSVSASIVDLGYINWKTYNKNLISNNGQFIYDGLFINENALYIDSTFSDSLDYALDQLWDEFKDEFNASENEDSYRSSLQTRIYLGASYELYGNNISSGTAGVLLQTEVYKGSLYPTFTLSYNQTFRRWLAASVSYSIMDGDYRNLGVGLSVNMGSVQFYLLADNIMAANTTQIQFGSDSNSKVLYPTYSKNVQIHTGFNINLRRDHKIKKNKKSDKNKKDKSNRDKPKQKDVEG